MLGDEGVGKTSLVTRFKENNFNPNYLATIGTAITKKEVELDIFSVSLAIWDIGGQEFFQKFHPEYYKGSEGALVVCDVTNFRSFENLPKWVKGFREVVGNKFVIFVVNKIDLQQIEVQEEHIHNMVKRFPHSRYKFTSAKDGTNTNDTFIELAKIIMKSKYSEL